MNADFVEVIWTVIAAYGLYRALHNRWEAGRDALAARIRHKKSPSKLEERRQFYAGSTRKQESLSVAVQVLFLLAGFGAMLRAPSGTPWSFGRLFIIGLLVTASLLVAVKSEVRARDRKTLDKMFEEDLQEGG